MKNMSNIYSALIKKERRCLCAILIIEIYFHVCTDINLCEGKVEN